MHNKKREDILKWEANSRGRATPKDELKRSRLVHHLTLLGDIKAQSKVLSIGCGTGYYELIIKQYTEYLYCLDISKEMLLICKERNLGNLIQANSFCLPFKSDIFDCAYAFSLGPIGSSQANMCSRVITLKEMKRVTKKNGRIIIGHPTTLWKQIYGLLRHKNPNFDPFSVSPSKVERAYKQNGITILCSMVLPSIPYAILRRMNYLKFDKILSCLFFDEIGPYLLVSGVK